VLAHGIACFMLAYYLFKGLEGWAGMGLRTIFFIIVFLATAWYLKVSPDLKPVLETTKKRLRL
jgi:hypothetical protein